MTFRISRWFKDVGGNKAIKEKSRARLQGVCHSITKAFLFAKRKPLFSLLLFIYKFPYQSMASFSIIVARKYIGLYGQIR